MKKWRFLLLIIFSITVLKSGQALSLTSTDTKPVHRTAVNQPVFFSDSEKIIKNHLVYMPVFTLSETMKLQMVSDPESQTILLKKANRWIRFSVRQQQVSFSTGMQEPVKIIKKNNNFYLPIKMVAKFFGYNAQLSSGVEDSLSLEQEFKKHLLKTMPLQLRKELPKAQKPVVYLTFDDGPNQHLDEILDILKAKSAKATFFLLEPQIRTYQEKVKRLVAEGHYPALHSVTHDKNKLYGGSPQNVINEMEQTRKTLYEVTGVNSKLTRAPYGSKPYMTEPFRNAFAADGLKMWDWNIDSMDWKYQQTNPSKILENIKKGFEFVKNKPEPIVILMHVTKGTAAILPQVIDFLSSQGYGFAAYNPQKHVQMNFWEDPRL